MEPASKQSKVLGFVFVFDGEHVAVVRLAVIMSVVPGHLLGNVGDF